jgi:hypothetical protein
MLRDGTVALPPGATSPPRKATMESYCLDELRSELNQLLRKQVEVLEARSLGTATDTDVLEYEIRQEIIHEMCNQLAHSISA